MVKDEYAHMFILFSLAPMKSLSSNDYDGECSCQEILKSMRFD